MSSEPISVAPAVYMEWANLLFLHWRVDASVLRPVIPAELEIDTFDGSAWVALVPFRMQNCRFRGVPSLPGLANFHECNVRTYVKYKGRSGVWFLSLDAQTLFPVIGGRYMWSLNYIRSSFEVSRQDQVTDYRLSRRTGPWKPGKTHVRWQTGHMLPQSTGGSLEEFLTERYWLFTRRWGRIMGGQVMHDKWSLRHAEVLRLDDSLLAAAGITVHGDPIALASDFLAVEGSSLCDLARLPAQR